MRQVRRSVAIVATVKAREKCACPACRAIIAGRTDIVESVGGKRGDVGAGRGTGLVAAIGAVAVIVVDGGDGDGYRWVRDAGEGCGVGVVFGDYVERTVVVTMMMMLDIDLVVVSSSFIPSLTFWSNPARRRRRQSSGLGSRPRDGAEDEYGGCQSSHVSLEWLTEKGRETGTSVRN